ncbi:MULTISPECIES: YbhB/YbcL family Raf kinase inhibitor-like protein [unclassified Pseudactinotalea]|uniref:YbhB/YbcL family Raf kinase inhibitor-like protein n=1 Tax=unclassified Pseudactinotalea TaxID=2649176 RepID=UPI00128B1D8D|nr:MULTISPECIES: YbhB/YbcL family Raf kinase inhibitor-like protein [unclassified Pseudactinotalea]MPV49865.1 YbhB/YbcL family Raf kinase inhibitor-like protein [Pseudactinotalea sp. HY160]QGH69129.1 YbhB/YbcL family Raf kinase inhibitor-like protein [Pseudactinotalea sp. HY158]
MDLDRPNAPDPYGLLPAVPSFALTSTVLDAGARLPDRFSIGGANVSPPLAWSGFPDRTRSFTINCFDPDAPTPAGYWHWGVANLPVGVTALAEDAGSGDDTLPGGALHVRTDGGALAYEGAGPPPGDRAHRYVFAVHALDVDALEVTAATSPTKLAFLSLFHTLARATLTVTFSS